ncbi:MAG: hypothetical protein KF856_13755 [Cyclobacteriaceae bacterium]|nr:hypothetical protein [Cyclobacteriaceae bacterium]
MNKIKPILFVSRSSPNESAGTPIILRRLLENFSRNEVVVLARKAKKERTLEKNFNYTVVETFAPEIKGRKVIALVTGLFTGLWTINKYKPRVLVAIYPDDGSLLLGYLLHRLTGLPIFTYFCDLYLENKVGIELRVAKWLQRKVFERAKGIMVLNLGMHQFFFDRYGIKASLITNAINRPIPVSIDLPEIKDKIIIGFSGNVSRDRVQPFRELVKLISRRSDIELRFFVPHDLNYLLKLDLWLEGSYLRFCKNEDELMHELEQCHLLYLPLTFEVGEDSVEQLATCFGTKAFEYILACRPILVHCPKDYFTYQFFSNAGSALLVNQLDAISLEIEIDRFMANYNEWGKEVVKRALNQVIKFKGPNVRDNFLKALEQ